MAVTGLESEWQRGWTSKQDLMNKSSSLISASPLCQRLKRCHFGANAREQIDAMLVACGWVVQNFSALNLGIGQGIALRALAALSEAPSLRQQPVRGRSIMTAESSKPRAGSRFIDAFLQSPLAGLTPWIVMALLSGPAVRGSVSAALGLSILFI